MKKILLASDGTPQARQASAYALSLLDKGDTLDVVYVIPSDLMFYGQVDQLATQADKTDFVDYIEKLGLEECSQKLGPVVKTAEKQGVTARLHTRWGKPAEAIIELACALNTKEVVIAAAAWGTDWLKPKNSASITGKITCNLSVI